MKRFKPLLIITVFVIIFFRKTFVLGLIPIPFDLLVTWFFPYNSGGWIAQGIITSYKGGHFASDAIRQIYPWKELLLELIKNGELPLWNPFAFSGTPLLANMQTAIFYPLNLLFFLIPNFSYAWAFYIASTLVLASFFMFLFLKSLKLDYKSAIFGSIAFASSGYMIVWLEWGTVAHQLIWLPLTLFAIKRWWEKQEIKYLLFFIFSTSATIFSGYPQGAAYNFIILTLWVIYLLLSSLKKQRVKKVIPLIISASLTLGITAVQWLPTAELFFHSAMRGKVSQSLSKEAALPPAQFATVFAPDYFGNRVTENYWAKEFGGVDYMDADLYIGAVTLLLALLSLLKKRKRAVRWLMVLILLGVVMGAKTPISAFIADLGIPVISTGAASEALLISIFALTVLSAFGFQAAIEKPNLKNALKALIIIGSFYVFLFVISFSLNNPKDIIARKALIVPFTGYLLGSFLLILNQKKPNLKKIIGWGLITVVSIELLFHANKILPFSSPAFAYPKHELVAKLREISVYDRTAGFWENEIATNFHTAFRLYSAEGYDPLYNRRYGEFMSSAHQGKLNQDIPRSDADITQTNEQNRNRIIDLASIKYIQSKITNPEEEWEEEPLKYDPKRFKLIWQKGNFKIYENLNALERVKLFYDWQVMDRDEDIIETLFNQQFNLHEQIILEKDPGIIKSEAAQGTAKILNYKSTKVEIETETDKPAILLLTDSFYPGWEAAINDNPTKILRANYTFRALIIPEGKNNILFSYQPSSFLWGSRISIFSLFLLLILLIFSKKSLPVSK